MAARTAGARAYFLVWTMLGAAVYPPTMYVNVARYAGAAFAVAGFTGCLLSRPALLARAFGIVLIACAALVTGSPPRM